MSEYFSLILISITFSSLIICILDHFFFFKLRKFFFIKKYKKQDILKPPIIFSLASSFFTVFLIVWILRSFIVIPYHIPTGSMLPTIQIDDFILVNKFSYGLKFPILNFQILSIDNPKRGDIIVFRYPPYKKINYVKTVIGLPGDHISYVNKQLIINGKRIPKLLIKETLELSNSKLKSFYLKKKINPSLVREFQENLYGKKHLIFNSPIADSENFQDLIVPKNHYFVMGDNRDNSQDSRYWGFVSKNDLVGKVVLIIFSWNKKLKHPRWNRIGKFI